MQQRERLRAELVALDRRHVWRPYTSSEDHESLDPFVIASAEGCWLHDVDGRRYLDANGSWWVNLLGHGHPRLRRVLREQTESLLHCSLASTTHEPAVRLAAELVAQAPEGLERVFFSDDGSTAVEVACKMAFQYWQQNSCPDRKRFITLSGAFHGDTVGAMSVSGVAAFRSTFGPLLFDTVRAPSPSFREDWQQVVEHVAAVLQSEGDSIAGVIVEPLVQGASGMQMWPAECLSQIRQLTRQADTFLIADEVFVGYGRLGSMWACDLADVTPDLLCLAKGFSGGVLPMAATLATGRIFDGFRGGKTRALMHGHSFCGNPLGASIAREVLAIYRDEEIVKRVPPKAKTLHEGFERLKALPGVSNIRCLGMVAAADLGDGGYAGKRGWLAFEEARRRGVYLRPLGDTLYVAPPLVISEHELALLVDVVYAAAAAAQET